MLVLSRKANQEIVIGDNIKVTILQVKGNTVRIGIEAPREVRVLRGELPSHSSDATMEKTELTLTFRNDSAAHSTVDDARILPFSMKSTNGSDTPYQSDPVLHQPPTNHTTSNRLRDFLARLGHKSDG